MHSATKGAVRRGPTDGGDKRTPSPRPSRSSPPLPQAPNGTGEVDRNLKIRIPSNPPHSSLLPILRARSISTTQGLGRRMAEAPVSPGGGGGSHESGSDQSPRANVREQDRYLPVANISRIMKKALPNNGKIAKDAKDIVQECVSEFISFVTSEASEKCQREKRKTINGDDLLWAMATLGFEDYMDPLKLYLDKYRETEGDSKGSAKGGDGFVRKDVSGLHGGAQPGPSTQGMSQQGPFTQGMNYMQSQFHNGNV